MEKNDLIPEEVIKTFFRGKVKEVKSIFEDKPKALMKEIDGDTPLMLAVKTHNLKKVKAVTKLAELNSNSFYKFINHARKEDLKTALHLAASFLDVEIVEYLLSFEEIEPDKKDSDGETALHLATFFGCNNRMVKRKQETLKGKKKKSFKKAIENEQKKLEGETKKSLKIIKILVDAGADINEANIDLQTPIFFAVSGEWCYPVMELCIELGADITCKNIKKKNPLQCALDYESIKGNNKSLVASLQRATCKVEEEQALNNSWLANQVHDTFMGVEFNYLPVGCCIE